MADGALPRQTRQTRTSAAAKKIELGLGEAIGEGEHQISREAFDALSPAEQLKRINDRLQAKGMTTEERPDARDYYRWRRALAKKADEKLAEPCLLKK
jgi:hypothetical protein